MIIAVSHVELPWDQEIHDGGGGIEQGGQARLAQSHLRKARALELLPVDHLEAVGVSRRLRNSKA